MEFNRNQFFMLGLVILFLGIQFRVVDSFVLNEKTTNFLAQQSGSPTVAAAGKTPQFLPTSSAPLPRKVVTPPTWLGWALMSIGSVLILHSLAMPKPGGA